MTTTGWLCLSLSLKLSNKKGAMKSKMVPVRHLETHEQAHLRMQRLNTKIEKDIAKNKEVSCSQEK